MSLRIDSSAVLRAMADHPAAFSAVEADLATMATKLLVKQVKAKPTTVQQLKTILQAIGQDSMRTCLDGFSANDLAGVVKKIDPHSAFAKASSDTGGTRDHIIGLLDGRTAPTPAASKPEKPTKAPKATAPRSKIGGILESKVHAGTAPKKGPRRKPPESP